PSSRLRRPRVRRVGADSVPNWGPVMRILQEHTSGEWAEFEGVGGSMMIHPTSTSLAVRQTPHVHTEIEQILAMLRRARYAAETIPTRETTVGIDDEMNFFDQPVFTNLPRNDVQPVISAEERAKALDRLAVRKVAAGLNQRWRRVAAASDQKLALRRF